MTQKAKTKKKTKKTAKAQVIDREDFMVPMRWPARMYCGETDTGAVILTGEQARAIVAAVGVALEVANPPECCEHHLFEAVETLNHTFSMGIGEECDEDCDCE